jgi:deoxycytidylate deaminase
MNYEMFGTVRWDKHFLDLALCNAAMSKDPNTRVGAVDRRARS